MNNNTPNTEYFTSSVVYTNIASLNAKFNELCAFVSYEKPAFIFLSETWLSSALPDSIIAINGYTVFRSDRVGKRGGGVCIYISDAVLVKFFVDPLNVNTKGIDSLFLKISNRSNNFVIGCIYRPPDSRRF